LDIQPHDRFIFHIALRTQWEHARNQDAYRGETLEREGFIHCSTLGQVLGVANAVFRGRHDLLLLLIQTSGVSSPLRYEGATSEKYPHIYGPIPREAVITVYDFLPDEQGRFSLPPEVIKQQEGW